MSVLAPFMGLEEPCNLVLTRVSQELDRAGFRTVQTFDLQVARLAHPGCTCPHHGTDECDCQMIVLLVYRNENYPATLVLHGQDSKAWLSLLSQTGERTDLRLEAAVRHALSPSVPDYSSTLEVASESRPSD